jgi:hypothetical protein
MFIDSNNNIYFGDMQVGDRVATEAEISEFENISKVERDIEDLVAARKQAQYAPMVTTNGKTIYGTSRARDNLFKVYQMAKGGGATSLNWLDVNNIPFSITLVDIEATLNQFIARDTQLYFDEAQAIMALKATL